MKSKKIISLISAITLTVSLLLSFPVGVNAEDHNTSEVVTGTQDASPQHFIQSSISTTNQAINYGNLDVFAQRSNTSHNVITGTAPNTKTEEYVVFSSEYNIAPEKYIEFNEGATNSDAFYKVTPSGEDFMGLLNVNWIKYRDKASGTNIYVTPQISGDLSATRISGLEIPDNYVLIGNYETTINVYTTSSAISSIPSEKHVYVALTKEPDPSTTKHLYVGENLDLRSNNVIYDKKGDTGKPTFYGGNNLVLSEMPENTDLSKHLTLDFGYKMEWDKDQSNSAMQLDTLIDMPVHAATGRAWHWNLNITGEYLSDPQP